MPELAAPEPRFAGKTAEARRRAAATARRIARLVVSIAAAARCFGRVLRTG